MIARHVAPGADRDARLLLMLHESGNVTLSCGVSSTAGRASVSMPATATGLRALAGAALSLALELESTRRD